MRDYERVKVAMRKYANGIRLKAIVSLGGRCQGTGYCPEDSPDKLNIIRIDKELAKMDNIKAYRTIAESLEPNKIAKVLCNDCKISMDNASKLDRLASRKATRNNKRRKVWIAGEMVDKPPSYDEGE
jgi:hypothetical protein